MLHADAVEHVGSGRGLNKKRLGLPGSFPDLERERVHRPEGVDDIRPTGGHGLFSPLHSVLETRGRAESQRDSRRGLPRNAPDRWQEADAFAAPSPLCANKGCLFLNTSAAPGTLPEETRDIQDQAWPMKRVSVALILELPIHE